MSTILRRTVTALAVAAVLLLPLQPAAAAPDPGGSVFALPDLSEWLNRVFPPWPSQVSGGAETAADPDPGATGPAPDGPALLEPETTTGLPEPGGEAFPMGDPNG